MGKKKDTRTDLEFVQDALLWPQPFLQDLRWLYGGNEPTTPGQKAIHKLFRENPKEFIAQMRAAEREYAATVKAISAVKATGSTTSSQTSQVGSSMKLDDEAQVKVEELIERLLKEAQP